MKMAFIDLDKQYQIIKDDVQARINAVLAHGKYIMGPEVTELEEELAAFCGTDYAITCSSGTDALLLALMAWDIGPGDAVFVPPFSFFATVEVISLLGATPIFVDVEATTFCIDAQKLAAAISAVTHNDTSIHPLPYTSGKPLRPKAIIPVDLFGTPAPYEQILPLAKKHDLYVLEDAAQGFGGKVGNRRTCGLGCDAAATSFFPAKPLGCYGDGGAVFTDNAELAETLRSLRVHGKGKNKYDNVRIGMNGRLDTIQAAVLLTKLTVFEQELIERERVAQTYTHHLQNIQSLTLPQVPKGRSSAWAQFSILYNEREHLIEKLQESGIPTAIYYEKLLPMLNVYRPLGYKAEDFPVAHSLTKHIVSLPMHPYLTDQDIEMICQHIITATH